MATPTTQSTGLAPVPALFSGSTTAIVNIVSGVNWIVRVVQRRLAVAIADVTGFLSFTVSLSVLTP